MTVSDHGTKASAHDLARVVDVVHEGVRRADALREHGHVRSRQDLSPSSLSWQPSGIA
jgi:hypothetical protein